jgi:hypothetical protein
MQWVVLVLAAKAQIKETATTENFRFITIPILRFITKSMGY